jgi:hypothetical protein
MGTYIKALEHEVLRLQKVEATARKFPHGAESHIKRLERQVSELQKREIMCGRHFDTNNSESGQASGHLFSGTAAISLLDQNGTWTLTAQMEQPNKFYTHTPSDYSPDSQAFSTDAQDMEWEASGWMGLFQKNPLLNCQAAINFILRLFLLLLSVLPSFPS